VDRINQDILTELTKDGQKSFRQIARQLSISSAVVKKRYERMKEKGIIVRPIVIIDLSKIGFQGKAYLLITKKPNYDKKEVVRFLRQMQTVYLVAEIVGEFDILAMVPFRDFNSVIELVNKIRTLPSLSRVEMALTSDTSFPITKYYRKMSLPKQ
jgi:DNA-binding Lrp family transcriptional regulator